MDFLKLLRRNLLPLCFLLLVAVPWSIARVMSGHVHACVGISGYLPQWGDSLPELLLMTAAFYFSSRVAAVGAVLLGVVTAVLKTAALILYQQAMMPFNLRSVRLVWAHTDHAALTAFLGEYYWWYLIPLILLFAALTGFGCVAAWKMVRQNEYGRKIWSGVFALLTLVSLAANCAHYLDAAEDPQIIYSGHLVTPLPALVIDEVRLLCKSESKTGKKISPESLAELKKLKIVPYSVPVRKQARFDRIFIIAVESLDLDFTGGVNPQMPPGITPELDALMRDFPHLLCYYTAAQPTSWGLGALLLSRLDFDRDREREAVPSLFTEAAKSGYAGYYFSACSGIFGDNGKIYQELFGAQKQYFLENWQREFPEIKVHQWGVSDEELYRGVLKILHQDNPEKFIALISTMDTHPDYTASGTAANDPRFVSEPFLNALHSADCNIGDFIRNVTADKNLYNERTLIVITADHTATHGRNYLKRKDYSPERIPLIFISQQKDIFSTIPSLQYASAIDLPPTLLTLIGAEIPQTMMGRSLFDGKNAALSRTMDDELLIRLPDKELLVDLKQPLPPKQPERALYEWFHAAY